jgi:hypothetical protein
MLSIKKMKMIMILIMTSQKLINQNFKLNPTPKNKKSENRKCRLLKNKNFTRKLKIFTYIPTI